VKQKIGFGGLERIQHETLYLIDKNYRIMKKTMKISGVVAPILIALGALFGSELWLSATLLLVLGFFLLSLFFLPSAIYVSYKEVSNKTKKFTHITGFIATFFLSISFLFKINHWPPATIFLTLGVALMCLVFLPSLIYNKIKDKEISIPKYIFILALLGLIIYILAFMFKMMHWPGATILFYSGSTLLIFIAFPLYVYKTYKNSLFVENSFIYIVLVIVWIVTPTTLISINVSTRVLGEMFESDAGNAYTIEYLQEKNNLLFTKTSGNKTAFAIHTQEKKLYSFIQCIKIDMVKVTDGVNSESLTSGKNVIITNRISNYSNMGSLNLILFNNDHRGEKLRGLLSNYKALINSACEKTNYLKIMNKTLEFDLGKPDDNQELLLASLNRLGLLQISVLQAEQTSLFLLSNELKVKNCFASK